MALPLGTTGSLSPAFATARLIGLAVKLPYAFTLDARLPTVLREPLDSSVTLLEETAPVKLPTKHCPEPCFKGSRLECQHDKGGISHCDSTTTCVAVSQSPTYSTHDMIEPNTKLQ